MARKYKTHIEEKRAVEFSVTPSDLDTYKDAWLILSNHAREYPSEFYRVSNNIGGSIYVCTSPEEKDHMEAFLEQFGEVQITEEDKYVVFIDVTCDYTRSFDEDYVDSDYVIGEIE